MTKHCVLGVLLAQLACVPEIDENTTLVSSPRILAVRGIPAESRPNTPVRYEALIADPTRGSEGATSFSYCTEPRSAEERTGVSEPCLRGAGLVDVESVMPANACSLFGPNTPPGVEGEAARRPSDPDPTGGYFIPVLAGDDEGQAPPSFGFQRIRCDLAGATRDIFEQYESRYRANRHPVISLFKADDRELEIDGANVVPAGQVTLTVEVRADSFESYVVYSAQDSALYDREEELHAHWFTSTGELGASEGLIDARSRQASVQWTRQNGAESTRLWVVVRDSRGGSVWAAYEVSSELDSGS